MTQDPLQSSALREAMIAFVIRRGAGANAEDLVQIALLEAWAREDRPSEPESLRRWLWGILRHKLMDLHRKQRREVSSDRVDEAPASKNLADDQQANNLLEWASRNLPAARDAQETLAWLLREAEGESLETIANEAALPPARVRKRVSRLREHFRAHWQKEALALAALGVTLALVLWLRRSEDVEPIARDPQPTPEQHAQELRQRAHVECEQARWQPCLDLLDEARRLGSAEGDAAARDRTRAEDALRPAPEPAPLAPSTTRPAPTTAPMPPPKPHSVPDSKPTKSSPMPSDKIKKGSYDSL